MNCTSETAGVPRGASRRERGRQHAINDRVTPGSTALRFSPEARTVNLIAAPV